MISTSDICSCDQRHFAEMAAEFVHERVLGDLVASFGEFVVDDTGLAFTGGGF